MRREEKERESKLTLIKSTVRNPAAVSPTGKIK